MKSRSVKIIGIIVIVLLSLAAACGVSVHFCGIVWGNYTENYIKPMSILNFSVFVFTFLILFFLLKITVQHNERISRRISVPENRRLSKKQFFLIAFAFLVLLWMPYLLSFAPASILADSLSSFRQAYYRTFHTGVPIFYTLFVAFFLMIGTICGNVSAGIFLYACFQYLCLAFICAALLAWLYMHKVKTIVIIITALFYALFPAFPAYGITMWKDPIFSMSLVALSFILLNEKSTWPQILISALIILFFRSNGLIIMAIIAILTLCSKMRKFQGVICAAALLFSVLTTNALLDFCNAERRTEEALGIPLQQIAYTVVYDYDSLSEAEIESINQIIPVEVIQESYTPCLVDTIKWHEQFNKDYVRANTDEILRIWLSLLPRHLGSYIKAYALETYGFWMPFVQSDYGYIDLYIAENHAGIDGYDLFERLFGFSVKDRLESFQPYIGSGTLAWIAVLGCTLCIISNQTRKVWFYLPGILCWLSVMISTPVAFSLRYVFILIILAPVYILFPFIKLPVKEKGDVAQ